jgi:ribonuclease HI
MDEPKIVSIYTDGGCDPNPGKGGYGVVLLFAKHRKELSGGFRLTTNNRMELYAAIAGLQALKETSRVTLTSDSEYLVNAMTRGWIQRWERKGWKKVKNPDLWKILLDLCSQHQVTFNWIKGHAGHPENERCDQLAMQALLAPDLPADEAYELIEDAKRSLKPSPSESPKPRNLRLFDE